MRYASLLSLVCGLAGCAGSAAPLPAKPPPAAGPLASLVGTQWQVEDINGQAMGPGARATLRFDTPATVSGSGGCNKYSGGVRSQSGTVMFGPIQTTRMACPEPAMKQEAAFFDGLVGARGVEVDDNTLYFLDVSGTRSVRFVRLPGPPPSP